MLAIGAIHPPDQRRSAPWPGLGLGGVKHHAQLHTPFPPDATLPHVSRTADPRPPFCSRPQVSAQGRPKRLILFNPRTTGRPGRLFPYSPLSHSRHPPLPLFFQIEGKGRPGRPGRPVLAEIKGSRGCPGRPGIVRSRPQIGNRPAPHRPHSLPVSTILGTPKHWRASPAAKPTGKFTVSTSDFHCRTGKSARVSCPHMGRPGRTRRKFYGQPRSRAGDVRLSGQGGWGKSCAGAIGASVIR
jgi:hypothetical protein